MVSWFKTEKYPVTGDTISQLEDDLHTGLQSSANLFSCGLYHDNKFFYLRTDNKIFLNHFLFQHGFEEAETDELPKDLLQFYVKG